MTEKRWTLLPVRPNEAQHLQNILSTNPILCNILAQRGLHSFDQCKDFFRPSLLQLHDPYLMKDMNLAVDRILAAISRKEKILIYGDYDVDGTTAVACMYQFICSIHNPELTEFYIPHRYREGYGVSKAGVAYARDNHFSLVITLDCGIKSTELIAQAKEWGIDFIVCDHHLPDEKLPEAVAILNPKQADCPYPYKDLCGCGVGFKLISALTKKMNLPEDTALFFLDLVAIAIAADIVPMTGENRILVYHGLKRINQQPCRGIRSILELEKLTNDITIDRVVFVIAPRVNAAGRMDDARKAVELFIEKDKTTTLQLAALLQEDNSNRKEADATTTREALEILEKDPDHPQKKSAVVFKEDWHKGVVGIVASRLIEKHYKPTVVLTRSNGIISGSARSVNGFNLYEAIHACREHLLVYGGHYAAAGLSMLPESLLPFSEAFESYVSSQLPEEKRIPEILIDLEIEPEEIQWSLQKLLHQMEPFGPENMRPLFLSRHLSNTGYSKVLSEKHIRFELKKGKTLFSGIGFGLAEKFELLQKNQPIDLVYSIEENEYKGKKSLQVRVVDFKISKPTL